MTGRTSLRGAAGVAVLAVLAAAPLAGCGGHEQAISPVPAAKHVVPQRIVQAPMSMRAAAAPQADGTMWALAGRTTRGLFRFSAVDGRRIGSVPVSAAARSVAESDDGVLGLALGTSRSGALQLMSARTPKAIRAVPLPGPAREVSASGVEFYALAGRPGAASVTVINGRNGAIRATVPVPADAVSVAPDPGHGSIYVLEKTGLVEQVGVPDGKITGRFKPGAGGRALALSPDGGTMYVLKGTTAIANVAVVDLATESVHRVLPAPSHCRGLLVSASGRQLIEVVGTSGYGNIQVFAL
jgi:DNA-binding beta-propeller fold protein YncE